MLEKLLLIVFAVVPCLSNAEMTLRGPQLLAIPVEAGAVYEISVHAK